jgi:mono/diheme cytochrome c family protein
VTSALRPRVAAAALVVASLAWNAPASGQQSGGSVQAGAQLFRAKGCLECHMAGGGGIGPDLRAVETGRSFASLSAAVWNHIPQMQAAMRGQGMPAPLLEAWEIGDLVAFLGWLKYFSAAGDTTRGNALFTSKDCVGCHQVRGVGGVLGPNLGRGNTESPIALAAAMWNHMPAMAAIRSERGLRQPQFSGVELQDLIAYIEGGRQTVPQGAVFVVPGRSTVGGEVFSEKQCVECHQVRGTGGAVGPDLGRNYRYRTVLDFAAGIWNKGPQMLAAMRAQGVDPPSLTAQEMADLVAFFYHGRYFDDAGDPQRGAQLVQTSRCSGCHASSFWRGLLGAESPAHVLAGLWNHITIEQVLGEGGVRWPSLTEQDAADITAYVIQLGGSQ